MLAVTQSAALAGVDAHVIQVEINTGEARELKFILAELPIRAAEKDDRAPRLFQFSIRINKTKLKPQ